MYRPVSILPAISRLMERVIETQLRAHVDKLLPKEQHGFRKGHSCPSALAEIIGYVANARTTKGDGSEVGIASLDAAAAFDTVEHELLLKKLELNCGIGGSALALIKSYLSNRRQMVRMSGERHSKIEEIGPYGVPQG